MKKASNFTSWMIGGVLIMALVSGAVFAAAPEAVKPGALKQPPQAKAKVSPAKPKAIPPPSAKGMKAPTVTDLPPALRFPPHSAYNYSAVGKSDPFLPFMETDLEKKNQAMAVKKARAAKAAKPIIVSVSPLQRSGIGNYRVVGIASNKYRRAAVVEDAAGKFYPISMGSIIGVNGGKVVAILSDRVVVEKNIKTAKGINIKRVTMKLYQED